MITCSSATCAREEVEVEAYSGSADMFTCNSPTCASEKVEVEETRVWKVASRVDAAVELMQNEVALDFCLAQDACVPLQSAVERRSDPREVVKTIPWPSSPDQWSRLQAKVWAGHPKLKRGWIRCWSREMDREYYLRLSDLYTSFNIEDVREKC